MKEVNWNYMKEGYNNILRDYVSSMVKNNNPIDYQTTKNYIIENCLIKYHYIGKRQNTELFKKQFDVLFLRKYNYYRHMFDKSFVALKECEI